MTHNKGEVMEWVATLSPAAQVAAVIGFFAFLCVAAWGYFKWLRDM